MIEINLTLLIQMANFLIFLTIMNFVLYRPIRKIVAERKQMMEQKQGEIERLLAGAESAARDYDARVLDSRKVGREKIQELKAAAYEQEKELVKQVSDEAAAQLQTMRGQIKKEIGTARDQLKKQVKVFSSELAQKILGRSL